jgi:hypothetical protein
MVHAEYPETRVKFQIKAGDGPGTPYYTLGIDAPRSTLSLFLSPDRLVELRDALDAAIQAAAPVALAVA